MITYVGHGTVFTRSGIHPDAVNVILDLPPGVQFGDFLYVFGDSLVDGGIAIEKFFYTPEHPHVYSTTFPAMFDPLSYQAAVIYAFRGVHRPLYSSGFLPGNTLSPYSGWHSQIVADTDGNGYVGPAVHDFTFHPATDSAGHFTTETTDDVIFGFVRGYQEANPNGPVGPPGTGVDSGIALNLPSYGYNILHHVENPSFSWALVANFTGASSGPPTVGMNSGTAFPYGGVDGFLTETRSILTVTTGFTWSPAPISSGATVTFTETTTAPIAVSVDWHFSNTSSYGTSFIRFSGDESGSLYPVYGYNAKLGTSINSIAGGTAVSPQIVFPVDGIWTATCTVDTVYGGSFNTEMTGTNVTTHSFVVGGFSVVHPVVVSASVTPAPVDFTWSQPSVSAGPGAYFSPIPAYELVDYTSRTSYSYVPYVTGKRIRIASAFYTEGTTVASSIFISVAWGSLFEHHTYPIEASLGPIFRLVILTATPAWAIGGSAYVETGFFTTPDGVYKFSPESVMIGDVTVINAPDGVSALPLFGWIYD